MEQWAITGAPALCQAFSEPLALGNTLPVHCCNVSCLCTDGEKVPFQFTGNFRAIEKEVGLKVETETALVQVG